MQQDVLNVFLNESQVGTLLQENGALSFKYAPEYLRPCFYRIEKFS